MIASPLTNRLLEIGRGPRPGLVIEFIERYPPPIQVCRRSVFDPYPHHGRIVLLDPADITDFTEDENPVEGSFSGRRRDPAPPTLGNVKNIGTATIPIITIRMIAVRGSCRIETLLNCVLLSRRTMCSPA